VLETKLIEGKLGGDKDVWRSRMEHTCHRIELVIAKLNTPRVENNGKAVAGRAKLLFPQDRTASKHPKGEVGENH